jgi:hypothetical protein
MLAGSTMLLGSELSIALRIHRERALETKRTHSPMSLSFSFKHEMHDYGPVVGLTYMPLHVWVLWAAVCTVLGRVERRRRLGWTLLGSAVIILIAEHSVRAWLNQNGVYIGIPMGSFLP